ncbi:MAG TPA: carbohydrate ABC transporter permease [Limnochordia bacterium]|mgnify:CR=1 FL=1|jgi:putative chitobiose transport system permease protein|nr:carbohydrate ABC transporter permease [Limnochordia bacterium]HPT62176.1 carbohydrate ABC transporter permease [Bacillota bacterium]
MTRIKLGKLGVVLGLLVSCLIFLGPFLILLSIALQPPTANLFTFPPQLIPRPLNLSIFPEVLRVFSFFTYVKNSLWVSAATVFLQAIVVPMAGYGFARKKFPLREVLFLLVLATVMIPQQITLIPLFSVFRRIGLLDTHTALILPWVVAPFSVFIMRQAFITLPGDFEDAARIDGCSEFGLYWRIMLPLVKPAVVTISIFAFVQQWNELLWPVVLLKTPDLYTLPLGLTTLDSAFYGGWRQSAAGAVLGIIPTIIVFLLGQKHFVRGIASGGIKG